MEEIRLASPSDLEKVIEFYRTVSNGPNNKARWKYGIYPTDEDLRCDIAQKELYLLLVDQQIVSAAVLQMHEDELYAEVPWVNHNPAVIHILASHPLWRHQGYARKLLLHLIEVVRESHKDALHLDIVADNDEARHLYESVGFVVREDRDLYYPDTGIILSTLFERIL